MKAFPRLTGFVCSLFVCFVLLLTCTSLSLAQTAETGALTGTVTDPSGGVIAGATVTVTNLGTGQTRTTTTDANGSYKFSLLPPGNYSVKFSAAGFKTAEVPSQTVNVTETPVLNRSLTVGAQSEQITVESTQETIQTQNATNGGSCRVAGSGGSSPRFPQLHADRQPFARRRQQRDALLPRSATERRTWPPTESRQNQNNYSMDGSSIVNYVSGTAGQTGSYPGIAIPNPDTIQEFKVQTSQYDASSGRNPGANVEVVTKGGTNQFHGAAWEFNRNNFFNAQRFLLQG